MFRRRIVSLIFAGTALTVLLAVLASCGMNAAAPSRGDMAGPGQGQQGQEQGQQADDNRASPQSAAYAAQQERLVIKNAILQIVVANPQESLAAISKMAEDMGGWIVTSSTAQIKTRSGLTVTQASLTVRVPSQRLTDVLQQIKGSAVSVEAESVSGQDVTQAYTDLQSQLTNLEAAEAQLRKIMDSAGKTDDVLAVYRELVQIRGNIEVTKGRMKYYEQSAAFSSVQLTLIPTEQEKPLEIAGWRPLETAKGAFEALVNTLQFAVNVVIWLAVLVLPLLIVFGIPAWLIARAIRRRARPITTATTTAQ
jgi:Domain of unknown function (DUF4349)